MNILPFNIKWEICKCLKYEQYFKIRYLNKSFIFGSRKNYLYFKSWFTLDNFIVGFRNKYNIYLIK